MHHARWAVSSREQEPALRGISCGVTQEVSVLHAAQLLSRADTFHSIHTCCCRCTSLRSIPGITGAVPATQRKTFCRGTGDSRRARTSVISDANPQWNEQFSILTADRVEAVTLTWVHMPPVLFLYWHFFATSTICCADTFASPFALFTSNTRLLCSFK